MQSPHPLRTPLPSSPVFPLSQSLFPPSNPPVTPTPWIWTCHRCKHTYALAATRRCLNCSHRSCVADSTSKHRAHVCASAFDFSGWRDHNEWRRERAVYIADPAAWRKRALGGVTTKVGVLSRAERRVVREEAERERREKREKLRVKRMLDKTHNCWTDCDFPSHCHSVRFEEQIRVMDEMASSGSSVSDADEAITPPSSDEMEDVVVNKSDLDIDVAPYESHEEDGWFSHVWTGWEDSSDSDNTSEDDVSEEDRQQELDALAALARMD